MGTFSLLVEKTGFLVPRAKKEDETITGDGI
jgi:hypothetical protein